MVFDAEKQSAALREFREQRQKGTVNLVFQRSFSPKAGTEVTHYKWYSTNGLCAKVVETRWAKAQPSLTITDWSEAPVKTNPNILT